MLYYLKGMVSEILLGMAVIDCHGVGFAVNTSSNTLSQIHAGEEAVVYISEQIREDAYDLYGFSTIAEKNCFEMLISVSGVGPKAALSILSANTPEGVSTAIISGNEKALTVAPGIGKKIAQRVILELKDKMRKNYEEAGFPALGPEFPQAAGDQTKMAEAASALSVLGYSSSECAAALKNVDMSMTIEDIIRAALRSMIR